MTDSKNLKLKLKPYFKGKRSESTDPRSETFDRGIRPVLMIIQLLLLFPVSGLYSRKQSKLKFSWFSIISLLSFMSLAFSIFEFMCILLNFTAINFLAFSLIYYFLVILLAEVLLIIMAIKWRSIIRHWIKIDNVFLQLQYYRKINYFLKYKLRISGIFMIVLAMTEHCVYLMHEIMNEYEKIRICRTEDKNYLVEFYKNNKAYLAVFISYNPAIITAVFYNNFKHVVSSIFIDTMIILQSIGLAERFNQIFERLKCEHKQRLLSTSFWIEIRAHYVLLLEHVKFINDELSWLILLSCTSNVYFLVKLISNIYVSSSKFLPNVIYNWVAVMVTTFRICFVVFAASSLDHAMKKPLQIVRELPFSLWTLDVRRFYEIILDAQPLTGKNFFHITRKTFISIVGTLITYELVLLDSVENDESTSVCVN